MRRMLPKLLALIISLAHLASSGIPVSAHGLRTAVDESAGCRIDGPAERFAPRLEEMGAEGVPVVTVSDPNYWNGRGYQFIFERSNKQTFATAPAGGFVAGGIVLANDREDATNDLRDAREGWLREWIEPVVVEDVTIGEQTVMASRITPWEISPNEHMIEIFIGFRVCNASAHVLVAVGSALEAEQVARAYASRIETRLVAEATTSVSPDPDQTVASSPIAPARSGCQIGGDLGQYAPTLADFGPGGGAFAVPGNYGYWDGRGYGFGFERSSGEAFQASPWGGYLYGGVLRAESEGAAGADFDDAVAGWTRAWDRRGTTRANAPPIAQQSVILTRLTPWEVDRQQPMVEVFLAFRRCNVNIHFLLTVMPRFKPVEQARRYAELLDARLRR